jgi:hypothetical protein
MPIHALDTELLALVLAPLKMHQVADARLVCKSFRAATGDFEKRVKDAIHLFTQVRRLSPSSFLLHTRLGKHAVEFSPINPGVSHVARDYVVHFDQRRYIGRVSFVHTNHSGIGRIAVLWARNGFHHSDDNVTWISGINTAFNGRITSVQTCFVFKGQKALVEFELRDVE